MILLYHSVYLKYNKKINFLRRCQLLDFFHFDKMPFTNSEQANYKLFLKKQVKIINSVLHSVRFNENNYHYIYGESGVGKSFVLSELNNLFETSDNVVYISASGNVKFVDYISGLIKCRSNSPDKVLNALENELDFLHKLVFIIDDAHKLKESDLLFLDAVVKKIPDIVLIVSSNKRNFVVDKNRDDFSLNRLFCKYKIKPLSLLSSFSYIKNCVFNAFTATDVKRKNLFSFLSMFFIYIFSGGKISYINKISFNCLNLIFNENKRKVSFVSVFKVVFKNNMSVRYNVIILLFKFCVLFGSIFILTCGSYIFYNKYNDAKIDKIRQEIEMHNMQLEIID